MYLPTSILDTYISDVFFFSSDIVLKRHAYRKGLIFYQLIRYINIIISVVVKLVLFAFSHMRLGNIIL